MTAKKITTTSALQFFQLLRFGVLVFTGILLSKSSFTTEEIGTYETLFFLAAAVSFFWISGITQSLLTLYRDDDQHGKKSSVLFNTFLLVSLFGFLSASLIYVFSSGISVRIGLSEHSSFMNLVSIYVLINSPGMLTEYIYLLKKQSEKIIRYGSVVFAIQLAFVATPAMLGYPVIFSLYGLIASASVRLLWVVITISKYSSFTISPSFIKKHLALAFPLIMYSIIGGTSEYIDGFLVTAYFEVSDFAVFRYGAKELPLVYILANAFSNSFLPQIANSSNLNESLITIKKKSVRLIHILFPVSAALMLSSNWFYPIVFNDNFAESANIFNIFLLAIISRLLFPQIILIGLKYNKILLAGGVIEVTSNIALSLILLPFFGIIGIAIGTVAALFMEKLFFLLYIRYKLNILPSRYTNLSLHLLYSTVLIIIFCYI